MGLTPYRVTIDTRNELYEYVVDAEGQQHAELLGTLLAYEDGWEVGTGLPKITAESLI